MDMINRDSPQESKEALTKFAEKLAKARKESKQQN